MKKYLFRAAGILLVTVLVCSLSGCVSIEQRLLNAFKSLQNAKAFHLLIDVALNADSGTAGPLKLNMDMAQSGQDYSMKGALTMKASASNTSIPFELYLKGGSMYMGTSIIGASSSGSSKYIRMNTTDAATLTGGMGVDPQAVSGFLVAVKGIDFKNVHFDFTKDTRTISGNQVQLDKVTLTPTAEESKKLVTALAGSFSSMVNVQGLTFTLWLGDSGIARVECQAKASTAANLQDTSGLIPPGPYTLNLGVDILELGDQLSLTFPDFTDQNTLDMQQYIQQVTQDMVQGLPGSSPVPSPTPTPTGTTI